MGASGALQTYMRVIDYGMGKVRLRFDRLLLQAFMAGVFIGMAGNACISFAGGFPTDSENPRAISPVMQKFIFASIFPVAFIAIITTGAELFTGNTMTMLICLFERRVTVLQLLKNWAGSLIGNWLGTLFSAYFLTYLCCNFDKSPYFDYLNAMAEHKTSHGWASCFLRGVGCNTWVCLAVWFVIACEDWAGKILALWFPIVCFVLSSYEHIIANLYTLQLCAMFGVRTSLSTIIVSNLLPTFLGNLVGGCGLIGAVYYYNFYPSVQEEMRGGAHQLEFADGEAPARGKDHALLNHRDEAGKGGFLEGPTREGETPRERSGFLFKDGIPSLQLPIGGAGGGGGYCPAGAATAAECSERSSTGDNGSKEKSSTGTSTVGAAGAAAGSNRGGQRDRSGAPAYRNLNNGAEHHPDTEKSRNPISGVVASADTWGGEASTKAGCGYSNDGTTATGGGEANSSSSAILKPVAVHGAAVQLLTEESTADDLWRGSSVRFNVQSPCRKQSGYDAHLTTADSTAVQLTSGCFRQTTSASSRVV